MKPVENFLVPTLLGHVHVQSLQLVGEGAQTTVVHVKFGANVKVFFLGRQTLQRGMGARFRQSKRTPDLGVGHVIWLGFQWR